jgi:CBS domain-containing protein
VNAFVRDVMTPNVITVKRDAKFEDIAAALREHRISAVPVVDEESRVIGVVSESDLLAKLAFGIDEDRSPGTAGILHWHQLEKAHAVTAAELMTSPPMTASPDDTVEQAARVMYKRNVKRLPVTDSGGHLAGIVSRADVLAVYTRADADIAAEIRVGILTGEPHREHRPFDLSVRSGVVTLYGAPLTPAQGERMTRQARHVQGVVAVRDRLDYPLPRPGAFDALASFPVD